MLPLAFAPSCGEQAGSDRLEPTMTLLRFASVLMLATAATLACSDDDDSPSGGAGAGGEQQGGAGQPGNAGGAGGEAPLPVEAGTGGQHDTIDPDQGGAAGNGPGGETGGGAAGAADSGGAGGAVGGAGGASAEACVNAWDGGEAGASGEGGAGGASGPALELIGQYADNFLGTQRISATMWNDSRVVSYDNDQNVVYTQAPCDDLFNPRKFGKIVYTEPSNGSFYFCMLEYALDSLTAARASTKVADASNPDSGGCGGFSWTKATAQ
jgi:hypothetical protein